MIWDQLKEASRYRLPDLFRKAFRHSLTLHCDTPVGRTELEGEDLFVTVSEYRTVKSGETKPESHVRYADIQIVLSGRESVLCYPVSLLPAPETYDRTRDLIFYPHTPRGEGARVTLESGLFAVFFPWDGHMPGLMAGNESETVKKAVYKVRMEKIEIPPAFLAAKG